MNSGNDGDGDTIDPTPASWLKFGQRNILYLGFIFLLIPFGLALDGPRAPGLPMGATGLGGLPLAIRLCGDVSAGFFLLNAALLVVGLMKGQWTRKVLIGCALPSVVGLAALLIR